MQKNSSQIGLSNENVDYEGHRKSNRLVECMTSNKSVDDLRDVFNLKGKGRAGLRRTLTPVDHNLQSQKQLTLHREHAKKEVKKTGRKKWDQEAERILNVVRKHKEKVVADYNRSHINPYRNGFLRKSVTPKITERSCNLANESAFKKDDSKRDLIDQIEEDRRLRMLKRSEYGRKCTGLMPVQKDRNEIFGTKLSSRRNEQREWREGRVEDDRARSIISSYKMKLKKINEMKKVRVRLMS
eukprot:TRINITY_DN13379_c0_g3_i1.p1 TRINITY_DN13379_c0_g3~~TRINITY_DN13379_c0_g3_i1.p1  ORF type:complete len:241 (+),score=36.80 TRINITY_DN13379_c0_g3_i1:635-1357(+)